MQAKIKVLADDMMPGVEACLSQWRDAQGRTPEFTIARVAGRSMQASTLIDAQLLLVRSITCVDAELLAEANALRFVGSATIGQDHLDLDALEAAGVTWSTAPGCNAQAVAEWVLATVLRQAARDPQMTLAELRRKRVGVVGMGQVGRRVAALLSVLGLQVVGCDPLLSQSERADLAVSEWQDLASLLPAVDIVCLHTPLTRTGLAPTHHLFNAERLALLRPSAWLINAGRGDVIEAAALAAYLQKGIALLDVLPNEPVPALEIIDACQQVSPHIAGHSLEGKWRGTWQITAKAAALLGYEQVGELADIIPAQAPPVLQWSAASAEHLVAPYAAIMAQVVDCAGDDQRLRAAIAAHPGQASAFDGLRKHYATRREIAAHRISGVQKSPSAQQLLTDLGFCC